MQEKKPSKGREAGIVCIGMAIIGIVWTIGAYSMTKDSPFGSMPTIIMTTFGIVFTGLAVLGAVKAFTGSTEENGGTGESTGTETAQSRGKSEKWTCAYCKTTVDGDSAFCPACGAGRKGKQ